ncbi:DUF2976 domain-containing protein [Photobacterium aquimaris]|uniref:DUF2976 domain-containing protein n=1 Tax=Photobacterium aquimaris TaxID=512643 RepID=A0A2T3I0R2_9GAMM|nr:DUF2976 domain-containing protein [Photobacterium aquimaris]OBU25666.1 hypothetical protein AYY21_08775 [Photobacterium aquimaris]PQJ37038.1 hypothetical protein BTN98_18020 [Photobacterium aquimaris]PSU10107.1 DUF2976 domain-containing protein [Photobacterium aquimaris]
MKNLKKPLSVFKKAKARTATLLLSTICSVQAHAAGGSLPSADVPGGASSDYIATGKNIVFGVAGVVIAAIVLAAFVVVSQNTIAAYNNWRNGKSTFFDLGLNVAVAIILIIAVIWIMGTAKDSFGLSF